MNIKGYITNLGKYKEGISIGEWVNFPISDEDFQTALKSIGCNYKDEKGRYIDTGYKEYFFADWESDFINNFGENENVDDINEKAKIIDKWDENIFAAACEVWGVDEVIKNDSHDYNLYKNINNDYDLGYYWAAESGCYNVGNMGILLNYIDYEAFGHHIAFEANGGFTDYGWIEYVG